MTSKTTHTKTVDAITDDVPFTARLPDGRTLFVLLPGKWCELDVNGEVLFKPDAARFLDRVQALAMRTHLSRRRGSSELSVKPWG